MRFTWPVLAACLALVGCGGPSFPPETDAARGRELLKTVLDAWKNGGRPDDLKQAAPPVVASDPDWKAGCKLTGYEIAPEDRRAGLDLLVAVTLQLTRPDGKALEKKVNFKVGVGDATVVLRSE